MLRQSRPLSSSPDFGNAIIRLLGSKEESDVANSMAKMTRQRSPGYFHPYARWNQPQHFGARSFSSRGGRRGARARGICSNCGQHGHFKKNCSSLWAIADLLLNLLVHASPSLHVFRDPAPFVPGQLHNNLAQWEYISEQFPSRVEPISFIRNKVDVADFIVPFKGKFAGKSCDAPFPPRMKFPNKPICSQFEDFISAQLLIALRMVRLYLGVKWGKSSPHMSLCP